MFGILKKKYRSGEWWQFNVKNKVIVIKLGIQLKKSSFFSTAVSGPTIPAVTEEVSTQSTSTENNEPRLPVTSSDEVTSHHIPYEGNALFRIYLKMSKICVNVNNSDFIVADDKKDHQGRQQWGISMYCQL